MLRKCAFFVLFASTFGCHPPPPPPPSEGAEEPREQAVTPEAEPEAKPTPKPEPKPAPEPERVPVAPTPTKPALLDPASLTETAPERYMVVFETTKGEVQLDVRRSWAPKGADRFYNLVQSGFFDDTAFFRVVAGFVAQIGLHGDPAVNAAWRTARIDDDPVTQSNVRGMLSFATSGPNTRTTQFFINLGDNARLDGMGFAPFGRVRNMNIVDKLYSGYGEGAPAGRGPIQSRIQAQGNSYLREQFPKMDYITKAYVAEREGKPTRAK
jgi:peptidyl-prolyl cis-trans isomerase A (cyclophilin A)